MRAWIEKKRSLPFAARGGGGGGGGEGGGVLVDEDTRLAIAGGWVQVLEDEPLTPENNDTHTGEHNDAACATTAEVNMQRSICRVSASVSPRWSVLQ